MIHYRIATPDDAAALSKLGAETFVETFGHLYQPSDLAMFLETSHSTASWRRELLLDSVAVNIAEDAYAGPVGYAKIGTVKLPVAPSGRPALELRSLYVRQSHLGEGVGPVLMDWVMAECRARGALDVFLSVYTANERAKRFYKRYGFMQLKEIVFLVGTQADPDLLFQARLDP